MVRLRVCCLQTKIKGPGASLPSNEKSWGSPDMDRTDQSDASPIRPETESVLGSRGWRQSGKSEETVEDTVKGSRERAKKQHTFQRTHSWRLFEGLFQEDRWSATIHIISCLPEVWWNRLSTQFTIILIHRLWTHQSADPEFPEQELHSGSRSNLDDQAIRQWTSALHYSLLQHLSSWWFFPGFLEERDHHPNSEKGESWCARGCQLLSDIEFVVSVEAVGTLCQQTVERIPVDQQPASIGAICLQKVPINRVGRIESPVRHLRSSGWENGDVTRATWPECGIRHSWPSNPLRQTALRVWTGWFRSKLVQILPNQPNNLCSLQRADIRNRLHSLRHATGIGAWSNPLHCLRGRSHQHSGQTWICCSLLCWRPPDLRLLTSIFLFESGGANVELCRRDWRIDGQQSTQTQPFKDGADLAWILSTAGALPSWWTQHRWGTHQAGYARPWPRRHDWQQAVVASSHQPCYTNLLLPSASSASRPAFSRNRHGSLPGSSSCAQPTRLLQWSSWLATICRCKFTSTMLHELASTICIFCESSGILSRQTRLTPRFELLCTADSITAMKFSLVCFSTRLIGFNPFSVPQLALSLAYPSGPAFRTPCTTNYTGSPSQKGSSSNSLASFSNVYTIAHPDICLNTAYRSLRSLVVHTWDLRRPVPVCASHLHQQNWPSWILSCWSNSLELSPS